MLSVELNMILIVLMETLDKVFLSVYVEANFLKAFLAPEYWEALSIVKTPLPALANDL